MHRKPQCTQDWCFPWFQASMSGAGTFPPLMRVDYCISITVHLVIWSTKSTRNVCLYPHYHLACNGTDIEHAWLAKKRSYLSPFPSVSLIISLFRIFSSYMKKMGKELTRLKLGYFSKFIALRNYNSQKLSTGDIETEELQQFYEVISAGTGQSP